MNQPIEQRFEKIEQRIEKLEKDRDDIAENEKLLLKLARQHRIMLQGLDAKVENIQLDLGDMRERFDNIERTLSNHGEMLTSHGEMLTSHGEMLTSHGEMLTSHGEMLKEILLLLKLGRE